VKHALLALVALALTATVAQADSLNVRLVGSCDTPGQAGGVAVSGNYAYVADDSAGLRVISVSDPAHPVEVGYYDTPGVASSVAVAGNYAYVADGATGLRVISVSDPAHPTEVGYYDTPGYADGVAVAGSYAYVADGCLRVISVSDPAHPVEVGYFNTPGFTYGVAVAGNYAYVACYTSGLWVIAVSDPAHPVVVGFYGTADLACGVTVAGSYAYVAVHTAGLQICQFYGAGIEEGRQPMANGLRPSATVIRGVLMIGDRGPKTGDRAELLDASGRKVLDIRAGANDVSRLAPGVYFMREAQAQAQAVRKVVVTK
jgi:hypothetical protein